MLSVILLYFLLPLGSAVQFGGDEGNMLMPDFLCSKGYALYKDVWNDQSPLHFALFAWVFRTFGPSIVSARLVFCRLRLALVHDILSGDSRAVLGMGSLAWHIFSNRLTRGFGLSVSVMRKPPHLPLPWSYFLYWP